MPKDMGYKTHGTSRTPSYPATHALKASGGKSQKGGKVSLPTYKPPQMDSMRNPSNSRAQRVYGK